MQLKTSLFGSDELLLTRRELLSLALGRELERGALKVRLGRTVKIMKDGRCNCDAGTRCPLGRTGSELRCTRAEVEGKLI